jgi:hypothetical protein
VTNALLLALFAMWIPPPPSWQPPHFSGPGLLCGTSYGIDLLAGESATTDWPGEFLMTQVFGTDHIAAGNGEVTISELGPRARPRGASRPAGRIGGRPARYYGDGLFAVELAHDQSIRTVTFRVPISFHEAGRQAVFTRVHFERAPGMTCLQRDNPAPGVAG